MKLLIYNWNSLTGNDVNEEFKSMHISYDSFTYDFKSKGHNKLHDEELIDYFKNKINTSKYDAVFSINYWPAIAEACYLTNIKYISWSYDCPFDIPKPEDTLIYPNVYCFVFDKVQQSELANKGLNNIYYLPLAVNTSKYRNINSVNSICNKYRTDVSFIGSLYNTEHKNSYPIIHALVSERTKNILNQIITMQRKNPSNYILDALITDSFAEQIGAEMHNNDSSFTDTVTKHKVIYALQVEIARLDRISILNLSGKRYKTDFYSGDTFEILEGVTCHPYVDYNSEMPWIFAASKVNLNPTLPAIQSGINQRAFDITACGGFLLMNNQPEIERFFEIGKEVGIYSSIYDFTDKLIYYMSHESEREKIALAGRIKCLNNHTMKKRLEILLKKSCL